MNRTYVRIWTEPRCHSILVRPTGTEDPRPIGGLLDQKIKVDAGLSCSIGECVLFVLTSQTTGKVRSGEALKS